MYDTVHNKSNKNAINNKKGTCGSVVVRFIFIETHNRNIKPLERVEEHRN